jgi:hypothetical protein
MSNQQQNIRLPTPTVLNHRNASLGRLWNSLTGKTPDELSRILLRMNRKRLFHFLEFMHNICLHDQLIEYSQERLEHFQTIMMCCPRLILTRYLLSIDEQCVLNLLEQFYVIWTMYLVGLLELQNNFEVDTTLNYVMNTYENNFGYNLILRLVREASNRDLPTHVRQNIFDFVCENPNIVLFMAQNENEEQELTIEELFQKMNPWMLNFSQEHDLYFDPRSIIKLHFEVDAVAFVEITFPQLDSLSHENFYCSICCWGPDEKNNDGSKKVFRSMLPCCNQMCCHDCLVKQATVCNRPDSDLKNTSVFVCLYCRHETFFLH